MGHKPPCSRKRNFAPTRHLLMHVNARTLATLKSMSYSSLSPKATGGYDNLLGGTIPGACISGQHTQPEHNRLRILPGGRNSCSGMSKHGILLDQVWPYIAVATNLGDMRHLFAILSQDVVTSHEAAAIISAHCSRYTEVCSLR